MTGHHRDVRVASAAGTGDDHDTLSFLYFPIGGNLDATIRDVIVAQ
jgi:hypothetical protein